MPQSDARSACRLVRFGHQCSEDVCDKVAGRFRHDNLNRGGRGRGGGPHCDRSRSLCDHRQVKTTLRPQTRSLCDHRQDHLPATDKSRPLCDHKQVKITLRPQTYQGHFATTYKSMPLCDHRQVFALTRPHLSLRRHETDKIGGEGGGGGG